MASAVLAVVMPEPRDVMKSKVKRRLQGKSGKERKREIELILSETSPLFKDIISDLNKELLRTRRIVKTRSSGSSVPRKQGPRMVIAGVTNSGKSTLLTALTNASPMISEYEFCTTEPVVGTMDYMDIKIQLMELPPIYSGMADQNLSTLAMIKASDGLLVLVNNLGEYETLGEEFRKAGIRPYNRELECHTEFESDLRYIPAFIVYRKEAPPTDLNAVQFDDRNGISRGIYNTLGITRIYIRHGDAIMKPAMALVGDVTVRDVVGRLDERLLKRFRYARLWGESSGHKGERFGLEKRLRDGDIVRIYA